MTFFVLGPVCCTSIPQTPSSILPTPIPLNSVFTRELVPKKRSAPAQPPLMRAEAVPGTGPINPRGSTYPRGKGGACKLKMALQPEDDEAAAGTEFLFHDVETRNSSRECGVVPPTVLSLKQRK